MSKIGTVIATDRKKATVEVIEQSVCDECKNKSRIGACQACPNYREKHQDRVIADNRLGAQPGDTVHFSKSPISSLSFAVIVFVIPVLFIVAVYCVTSLLTDDPGVQARVTFASLILSMIGAAIYSFATSGSRCDYIILSIESLSDKSNES